MNAIRRLFRYEPYKGGVLELVLIRLFLVAMLIYKGDFLFGLLHSNGLFDKYNYDAMPVPNGLALFLNADWFTWIYHYDQALWYGLWVAGACFVAGFLTLPAIGYILVLTIGIGTLRNSQGHIHHGTQMMALTVLSIFIGYLYCSIKNLVRKDWRWLSSIQDHRLGYVCAVQGIAAYYFVAGVAKIEARGLIRWVRELQNMGVYVDRNGHQQFLAGGEQSSVAAYERSQMIASWINDHPVLTTLVFAPGLLAELVAPAAMLNRGMAFLIGVIVIGLHLLVGYIMQLSFPMNELLILIFLINIPFMISWLVTRGGRGSGLPELSQESESAGSSR